MQAVSLPGDVITTGYVLVEPSSAGYHPILKSLPTHVCDTPMLKDAEELTPRLIDMAALTPEQQETVSTALRQEPEAAHPPTLCAWLETEADIDRLARAIARFLIGPGPEGEPIYWRYFDPRVFSLTMHLFSPEQRDALLGLVTQWRFAWCGHWWSIPGPGREVDGLEGIRPAWPSSNQWNSLAHAPLLERVLRNLDKPPAAFTPQEILQHQRRGELALGRGRQRLNLSAPDDLIAYAIHCVRYESAFLQHPKLSDAWAALSSGATNWSALLARLDHVDYRQMEELHRLMSPSRGAAR
jgi:hypothetical protein